MIVLIVLYVVQLALLHCYHHPYQIHGSLSHRYISSSHRYISSSHRSSYTSIAAADTTGDDSITTSVSASSFSDSAVSSKPPTATNRRRELLKDASMIRMKPKKRISWEEKYDFDPLKADAPTVDYVPPVDPFAKWYVGVGYVTSTAMLKRRQEAWVHHMQWARRSSLLQGLRHLKGRIPLSDIQLAAAGRGSQHNVLDDEEVAEEGSSILLSPILESDSSEQLIESAATEAGAAVDSGSTHTSSRLDDLIPDVRVECEYTLLSADCMRPSSQLIVFRANDSEAVRRYLQKEPLAAHGGVTPWTLYEMRLEKDNVKDDDEEDLMTSAFTADLYDPYMFLTLSTPADDQARKLELDPLRQQILDDSLEYHLKAATDYVDADTPSSASATPMASAPYVPTYGNLSRVVTLGRLHHVQSINDGSIASSTSQERPPIAGQLLLFNARSRADALRYLSRDPLSRSVEPQPFDRSSSSSSSSSTMTTASTSTMDSLVVFPDMTLSAANLLDVSGLHHMMGRTFAQKWQLDKVGDDDTYDD
jgi:hypothetical protein